MEEIKVLDNDYIAHTYGRFDVLVTKGKGSLMYDEKGREYIDLGSGIAVNSFGICDDEWKDAVIDQLGKVSHTSNLYFSSPQAKLAKMLCERTGMKKVFFSNSGAEANECAIKVARKYSSDKYGEGRSTIITLVNSFHGRTITTLSATGQDVFHKHFGPFTEGFKYAHAGDIEELNKIVNDGGICGIMIELVQGEGGVIPLDRAYVDAIAKICKEKDILLIVDEVQTGNGRTGKLYAFENYGIKPDIFSTAKGLAGGLPFGACVMGEKTENTLGKGDHGSTFGGNPICAAGALSILSRIDDKLLDGVTKRSEFIRKKLEAVPEIESVTGLGLMLGISVNGAAAGDVVAKAIEKGCIMLTAKTKVRLLPALNIPMDVLEKGLDILIESIRECVSEK
ncbi:MAG: acetylornithine/succinylornithine family transaminase [Lachnospiraceae bacterium]|nr:acetylornithine/succinylornithine family transaminase [Lachnospiraceae bacterium]